MIKNLKTLISLGESIDDIPPEGKLLTETCPTSMVVTALWIQHTADITTNNSIAVLFSDPLVQYDKEKKLQPVEKA